MLCTYEPSLEEVITETAEAEVRARARATVEKLQELLEAGRTALAARPGGLAGDDMDDDQGQEDDCDEDDEEDDSFSVQVSGRVVVRSPMRAFLRNASRGAAAYLIWAFLLPLLETMVAGMPGEDGILFITGRLLPPHHRVPERNRGRVRPVRHALTRCFDSSAPSPDRHGRTADHLVRIALAAGISPIPRKSACWFCPRNTMDDVRYLVDHHPGLADRIIEMEALARPRLRTIEGLWRRPRKGTRGTEPRPGSMTEFILQYRAMRTADPSRAPASRAA